jgi:hypothetical protein
MMFGMPHRCSSCSSATPSTTIRRASRRLVVTMTTRQLSRAIVSGTAGHRLLRASCRCRGARPGRPTALLQRGDVQFVVTIPADLTRRVVARRQAADPGRGGCHRPPATSGPALAAVNRACRRRCWGANAHGVLAGTGPRHRPSMSGCTGATIRKASPASTSCRACSASSSP